MTVPSPDCGYTDAEQALMDAVDANPGPNCVTAWQEEPTPPYPQSRAERLAAALSFYADEENYTATLEDAARGRELRVVDDGGHRARAALAASASGEHYSGAAQDGDRIEVLEKALRQVKDNAESWHGNGEDGPRRALVVIARWCDEALAAGSVSPDWSKCNCGAGPFQIHSRWCALAAGSASPGGDET